MARSMRTTIWRLLLPFGLSVTLVVILTLTVWQLQSWLTTMGATHLAPGVTFYGQVLDQDGAPVANAKVAVRTSELVSNDWTPGGVMSDRANAKAQSVQTGAQGEFAVTLPHNHNILEVEEVTKQGYQWVKDWAWQLPSDARNNNAYYLFPGRYSQCPEYRPDHNRPAVFPLHLNGSTKPVGSPSRGGSDLVKDGAVIVNQPVAPKIPTTGPGAPQTPRQIEDAIGAYLEKINGRK